MPDEPPQKPKSCCCGFLRFHASTVAITSLLLLPILLLVLPGREKGGGGTTGFWTTHFQHGLPFAFLERQTVEYSGTWANNKFTPGAKPKDVDFKAMALKCLNNESFNSTQEDWGFTGLRMNLPEQELGSFGEFESESIYEDRFWSDPNRWPWIGDSDGEAMHILWRGGLVDLLLLLLTFFLFARFVEYRLSKRGSHFAFRLGELLVTLCVAGVFLAWITTEHRRAFRENSAVDRLVAAAELTDVHVQGNRGRSLSVLASETLDHGSFFPLLGTHLFRPVEEAEISIYYADKPNQSLDTLFSAMQDIDFPISLDISFDEQSLPVLKRIPELPTVTQFEIYFGFIPDWDYDVEAHEDVDLDLKFNFPQLRDLTVTLQSEVDQQKQLKMFTPIKGLERLELNNLNQQGITFFNAIAGELETLQRLEMDFEFEPLWDDAAEKYIDDIELNFRFELPRVKELKLGLDSTISQAKQLKMFTSMPGLKRLEIHELTLEGAVFLNSIAKELPVETWVTFADDVKVIELSAPIQQMQEENWP